ncbi:hypothetical protein, partial [Kocuria palustris]
LTHQLIQPNKKLLELVSADNLAHYRVLKQQTINQPVSPGPRRSVPSAAAAHETRTSFISRSPLCGQIIILASPALHNPVPSIRSPTPMQCMAKRSARSSRSMVVSTQDHADR